VDYEDHANPYAIGTWDAFTSEVKRMERKGGANVSAHPFPSTRLDKSRRQTTNLTFLHRKLSLQLMTACSVSPVGCYFST